MKAVVRPGGGDSSPKDGDLVLIWFVERERETRRVVNFDVCFFFLGQIIYHCTVRTLDGVVVESTRSECGGEELYYSKGILLGTLIE